MWTERLLQLLHALVVRINMRAKDKRLILGLILPQETRFHVPARGLICVSIGNDNGLLCAE